MMYNYKCQVIYKGDGFQGWQINEPNHTVQSTIEKTLTIMAKEPIKIFGASRTDRGVHSYGQVFNFFWIKCWNPQSLIKAINFYLNNYNITIINCEIVDINFHSRYNALGKLYCYKIKLEELINPFDRGYFYYWPYKISLDQLKFACKTIKESPSLNGFAHWNVPLMKPYNLKDLSFEIKDSLLILKFLGKGFFYNQIRYLVGHILYFISGKISLETFFEPLQSVINPHYKKILAPAHGLYLMKVYYQ